jgi:hypothetical protein
MDLITLDSNNQPAKLVQNYDSLIWTERFNTLGQTGGIGDFQITTGLVDQFMELLPEGQIVSLRESNVPMIVEDHKIDRKKNTPQVLTITGRSFDSILERRISIQAVTGWNKDWQVVLKTPSDVAQYIINQICVAGVSDPADIFPPDQFQLLNASDYNTSTGPDKTFTVARGNLYATVLALLQTEAAEDTTTSPVTPAVVQHGLRSIRPNAAGTANALEIYLGTDRTNEVYFDATRDLLDDGSYLFSKKNSANVAYFVGASAVGKMHEGDSVPTGFDRRVTLVDASQAGAIPQDALQAQVSMSLAEAHVTAMFDGSINQDISPYIYGVDYNLGDIVRIAGDYGLDQKARVTEYIRSEDNTGVKSYPTLTAIND